MGATEEVEGMNDNAALFNEFAESKLANGQDTATEAVEAPAPIEPGDDGSSDPYAGLPPDAIERIKAVERERDELDHRIKSDAGRVSAYQRQVREAQEELDRVRAEKTQQPSDTEIRDAMSGSAGKWGEFKEEYPEIAGAIEEYNSIQKAALEESLNSRLAPVIEHEKLTARERADKMLEERHAGWQDRVSTPAFSAWLDAQPKEVRAWAGSEDPETASTLISYYDLYLKASGEVPPDKIGGDSDASRLAERRQQQLEDGQTVHGSPSGIKPDGGTPETDKSRWFAYYAKKAASQG